MKIYFIRHGQTDWNKQLKIQGISDIPLNEIGELQAKSLTRFIKEQGVQFEKIWSSPLKRALKTSKILNKEMNCSLAISEELKEFDFGEWEGKTAQQISDKQAFDNWLSSAFLVAPPRGELFESVQKRLQIFLDKSLLLKAQKPVAIVAHQGSLVALKALLTQKNDLQTLISYRQANDEFDIMNIDHLTLERFKV